ncbi:Enoyl-CoA hydratase/carnithine racemase [Azospirillaceae bacterium]
MDSDLVQRVDRFGIATITLCRPKARNALSMALMDVLQTTLDAVSIDSSVRVVVLAGAGPAFCAGHDLREMQSLKGPEAYAEVFERCSRLMQTIVSLRQPVIARVHGVATAAGCQLAATCDLAIAAHNSCFATPGVNIGLFCSTPMVALTRAVGRKAAMEMLLLGDLIDATEALRIGLVNRVVPEAELDAAVLAMAEKIASKSSMTVAIGKEAFYRQAEMDLAASYEYAGKVMVRNMMTKDCAEGIDAFLSKRVPTWRGQ